MEKDTNIRRGQLVSFNVEALGLIDDYLASARLSDDSKRHYGYGLNEFKKYCHENSIKEVTQSILMDFLDQYSNKPMAKKMWCSGIRSFSWYLYDLDPNKYQKPEIKKEITPAVIEQVHQVDILDDATNGPNWAEYLDKYFKVRTVSKATESVYRLEIKRFFNYAQTLTPMDSDLESYNAYNCANCSTATAHLRLTVLKRFFAYLRRKDIYTAIDPTDLTIGAKVERRWSKRMIQLDYQRQILDLAKNNPRDRALFLLLFSCALRGSEVININIEDIRQESGKDVLYVLGKGHQTKDSFIVLPNAVAKAIKDYIADRDLVADDAIFLSCSNKSRCKRLSLRGLEAIVDKYFRAIGIKSEDITLHSCRHTAISNALSAGADIVQVQHLARHKDINTTMIYAHHLDDYNNEASNYALNKLLNL